MEPKGIAIIPVRVMTSYSSKDGGQAAVYTLGPLEAQDHALLGQGARERRRCLDSQLRIRLSPLLFFCEGTPTVLVSGGVVRKPQIHTNF